MMGKTVYLLAFLVSIVVVINAVPSPIFGSRYAGGSHHLYAGRRVSGDRLVLRQNVYVRGIGGQSISLQRVFSAGKFESITLLQALDQVQNGTGAYVNIQKGGPGTSNATLHFQSQRGRGINFVVELYARRKYY